jgi:hypothetical protein
MKKLLFLTGFVLLTLGMVAGSPAQNSAPGDQAPTIDTPKIPDSPDTAPSQGISGGVGKALDFLPSQASDTARNVLNTIIDTPRAQLGDVLSDILGGNQTEG